MCALQTPFGVSACFQSIHTYYTYICMKVCVFNSKCYCFHCCRSEHTDIHTLQIGPFFYGICDDRKTSRNVSCGGEGKLKTAVRGRGKKRGQGIRGNFTLCHKNERFSIFLISVNNSTNTLRGKELINANIYRYFERAKTADKLMKFLHDNNANADNDDSGKLHAESSLSKHEKHLLDKGSKGGLGSLWLWVWVDKESLPLKPMFSPTAYIIDKHSNGPPGL